MVQIQEQEEDAIQQQTTKPYSHLNPKQSIKNQMESSSSTSLSSHHLPTTSPAAHSPTSSISSIDSDHTSHALSPTKETFTSPSPSLHPIPALPPAQVQSLVPVQGASRLARDPPERVTKTEPEAGTGFASEKISTANRQQLPVSKRAKNGKLVKRAGLVLRFFEFVFCLVSFSVMAADKNRGWALDSFDRYIEFRYAMSVNVIGFAYSGLQGLDLLLQLTTGKDSRSQVRYAFDFAGDQVLAYLLLSASSSAFTRVDDWISNWGNDKFPAMATASIGVSFVAFIAFAFTSIISGYLLCTHKFT
ncbi:LOW QUALITY PROTEIN: CASP-like protein 4A1 [Chenopodium quinoa]|uniref:LOW QUALITY PROTEIN: CASP-like protein 4A1 n=1 Tax=Chenopodium quinoa TaxID=63459 RepID=UPI000B795B22|nr:LOW QUALITY PROTEIN: CASP-like protein 4A1 [Chenopodium quinoa]